MLRKAKGNESALFFKDNRTAKQPNNQTRTNPVTLIAELSIIDVISITYTPLGSYGS